MGIIIILIGVIIFGEFHVGNIIGVELCPAEILSSSNAKATESGVSMTGTVAPWDWDRFLEEGFVDLRAAVEMLPGLILPSPVRA